MTSYKMDVKDKKINEYHFQITRLLLCEFDSVLFLDKDRYWVLSVLGLFRVVVVVITRGIVEPVE